MANPKLEQEPTGPYFGRGFTTICPDCEDRSAATSKRTQYIVVTADYTARTLARTPSKAEQELLKKQIRPLFVAALWHHKHLIEEQSLLPPNQQDDIKIVGWRGENAPSWIPAPSESEWSKKTWSNWYKKIDNCIAPIGSFDDFLGSLHSKNISAVHYFSHGSKHNLKFKHSPSATVSIENIAANEFDFQVAKREANIFQGKFTKDANFYLYSCWAGLAENPPKTKIEAPVPEAGKEARDWSFHSIAAAIAQTFGIRTFGNPFIITLRDQYEIPHKPVFYYLHPTNINPDGEFISSEYPPLKDGAKFGDPIWFEFARYRSPRIKLSSESENAEIATSSSYGRVSLRTPFPAHFQPPIPRDLPPGFPPPPEIVFS